MDSLLTLLTIDDFTNKIISLREHTDNIGKYACRMHIFRPILGSLPIRYGKYNRKIAYIDWILRSDELYLCLNVLYHSTGLIKSVEAVSQQLSISELSDLRNIRTLAGKRFKRQYKHDKARPVYSVVSERIIAPRPFNIIENGMEHFAMRDKIIEKYSLIGGLNG